jgi:hypothetical protein
MGIKQHLACCPWAAQPSMKALTVRGVTEAVGLLVFERWTRKKGKRTRSAVQVGEVQDVSCAADGVAGAAEADLALSDLGGSREGSDGECEDGGVKHVDGLGLVVGWLGGVLIDCW